MSMFPGAGSQPSMTTSTLYGADQSSHAMSEFDVTQTNGQAQGLPVNQEGEQPGQQQPFGPVQEGTLNFEGLEQVLPPEVITDLQAQAEAYAQYHVRQLQSRLDTQVSQERQAKQQMQQRVQQLEDYIYQQELARRSPQEQAQLRAQMQAGQLAEREAQLRQQERQIQVQQYRQQRIAQISREYQVDPATLAQARSEAEAVRIASSLYFARRNAQAQSVPAQQRNIGGGQQAAPVSRFQIPNPNSSEFDQLVDRLKMGDLSGLPPDFYR